MSREIFVYWRVDAAAAEGALRAARAFQAELGRSQPGIQTGLYRRAEATGGSVTLMETYATAGGFAGAQQAELLNAASLALAGWASGERHVEVFDRMPG